MTILFFARLFWPHGGGVERHVLEVGKRLVAKGHSVIVVTEDLPKTHSFANHSKAPSAKVTGSIAGIQIYRIPAGKDDWFKKFRVWQWLWQHKELIRNADIVHAHDVFFWYLPFRFLYPAKPIYTTFHGYETKFPPAKKAIFVRKISEKLSWGNICVGEYIGKWYGTTPTYTTYGGVELSIFNFQFSKKKNKKLHILFIGRLEEDIGIEFYLEAIRKLKEKKDVAVTFLGDGSFKKEAKELGKVVPQWQNCHSGKRSASRIRSWTSQDDADEKEVRNSYLSETMQGADVVFASSYLSILSAMAAKKPIVAVYTNPLKRDYLTMTPFGKFISVVDSAEGIVNQVQNLEKTHAKVEQAYVWAKEQTWEKVVASYLHLWKL